jgi:probable addiction module antidote protein
LNVQKRISKATKGAKRPDPGSVAYEPWLIGWLHEPKNAAAYLDAAIEDGDPAALMLALRHVAQAQGGVAKLARKSKLSREATYRMLSKSGNPELRSLHAMLRAAGLRLSVRPI